MPAPLRRDVRLLGRLLGQVLEEAGGPSLLADVERLRRATIALRTADGGRRQARAQVAELVAGFDLDRAELVARAFTVYFQLVNLAEEQHRVRTLRERRQNGGPVRESFAAAVAEVRDADGDDGLAALLERLEVAPVLTAHPTEARRRAVVDALRRIAAELLRLDAPRLPGDDEATAVRRLLEEITGLWRTAQLRRDRPSPLDEVRSVMAVFDATLFRLVPATYRALEQALAGDAAGTGPPPFRPYLRWGSWVGGDRDGNPNVTAETTRAAMAIQADHVLRGLEAVTRRVGHALTVSAASTPPSPELVASLERDQAAFPRRAAAVAKRWPDEPYLQKLLLATERLAVTRAALVGGRDDPAPAGYRDPGAFLDDVRLVQGSLAAAGAARLAYGELQHLAWQAETFGFHLASLEVRQHAAVHAAVLAELAPGAVGDAAALDRLATEGWGADAPWDGLGDTAREVLETLRVMAELQARYGPEACRRYVVSFSRSAADLAVVRALARLAVPTARWSWTWCRCSSPGPTWSGPATCSRYTWPCPARPRGWSGGAGAWRSCSATRTRPRTPGSSLPTWPCTGPRVSWPPGRPPAASTWCCSTAAAAPSAAAAARPGGRSAARPPGRWPGASRSPSRARSSTPATATWPSATVTWNRSPTPSSVPPPPGPRRRWPPPRPATCPPPPRWPPPPRRPGGGWWSGTASPTSSPG
jgi:phosphoenolpyruvate carboxylase